MNSKVLRVLIADDHALIRQGIRRILGYEENISVVGEASDGEEALQMARTLKPDVLVMDINMPHLSGLDVLRILRDERSDQRIILLTVNDDGSSLQSAIDTGAEGYQLKDSDPSDLIEALFEVDAGENYIDKRLVKLLVRGFRKRTTEGTDKIAELTDRERDVLSCIALGLTNREIAERLFITEKTVKNHTTNIYRKLEVTDRVKAALYAIEHKESLPDLLDT